MSTPQSPPRLLPAPDMPRHRFNHFNSDVVDRIALLTVHQMMAGQLVVPSKVQLAQRIVNNNFSGLLGAEVEFRFMFHVNTEMASSPTATWMVVVTCEDPQHGLVNETTAIRPSDLYDWDDQKGWQHVLTFEHPYVAQTGVSPILDVDPLDYRPRY